MLQNLKTGDEFGQLIIRAIRKYDRFLLVLSAESIASDWVEREVRVAVEREVSEKRKVLVPIRLDDAVLESPKQWAVKIRDERQIGNFGRWQDPDTYRAAFERLRQELKPPKPCQWRSSEMQFEIGNRVQEQFGRTAPEYTQSLVHSDPAALQRVVALAQVRPGDVALDIATGAGHVAMTLAPGVEKVIAYDLTEEMLQETERNAAARGLRNLSTQRGQAEQLPFPDATFDIVTVRQAPHHFADIHAAIQEMARVAKKGARIVIVDSYAPEDPLLDRQRNHIEKLRDPSHVRNYSPREWRAMVSGAGLQITFEETDYCTENGRPMNFAAWTLRMRTPPPAVAELHHLFSTASVELRELLRIEIGDNEIGFCVPQITIAALR